MTLRTRWLAGTLASAAAVAVVALSGPAAWAVPPAPSRAARGSLAAPPPGGLTPLEYAKQLATMAVTILGNSNALCY